MAIALKATNLSFAYGKDKEAIDGLNVEIKTGAFCVFLGHNGSGKSTFVKLVTGLLEADGGEIEVFGIKLDEKTVYEIRSMIGVVFQNPDNQFIGATVRDDIAFGLENKCVPHEEMEPIIEKYAEKVGISRFLDREPANLSGGQKQRVAIAGVLATAPKIIIFDEATSMLDPYGKQTIYRVIADLRKTMPEVTIISITQDIEEALQADEVYVMNKGKIAMAGTPEEIFADETKLQTYGLDVPFVYKLKNELRNEGLTTVSTATKDLVSEICR